MNKDMEANKALNTEAMEKVSGGADKGARKLYKFLCVECGKTFVATSGVKCPKCGSKKLICLGDLGEI